MRRKEKDLEPDESIRSIIRESLKEYSRIQHRLGSGWIPAYRSGELKNYSQGIFFAFDRDYYRHSDLGPEKKKNVCKYLINMDSKIWDPVRELGLNVYSWSRIDGRTEDFERYGIEDGCDFEMSEEFSVTSTDGLAAAGKKLGYQATIIRDVGQTIGNGVEFDEICVYDLSIVRKAQQDEKY